MNELRNLSFCRSRICNKFLYAFRYYSLSFPIGFDENDMIGFCSEASCVRRVVHRRNHAKAAPESFDSDVSQAADPRRIRYVFLQLKLDRRR